MSDRTNSIATMLAAAYWRGQLEKVAHGPALEAKVKAMAEEDLPNWIAAAKVAIGLIAQPIEGKKITGTESRVCHDIFKRQQLGIAKYGQTVAENPLELREWLQHAYEECLDQAVYLRRAIEELDRAAFNKRAEEE